MIRMRTGRRRNFVRQYQYRRRATRSSSLRLASAPYRLGEGISLRASTSTRPRNPITAITVISSDQIRPMWLES